MHHCITKSLTNYTKLIPTITRSLYKSHRCLPYDPLTEKNPEEKQQKYPELFKIFQNNRKWAKQQLETDPKFFEKRMATQQPNYLFIGCSDSRVPAENLMGCEPGELFVHRNIANLVVNTDINCLSVIQYAVTVLKVKHVIVCGHYGCGGVAAALKNEDSGTMENWLRNIRDVYRLYQDELDQLSPEDRHHRLVELTVVEQCLNLFKNGDIQRTRRETGFPVIHGLVYDLRDGILKELDIPFKEYQRKVQHIYRLYPKRDLSKSDEDQNRQK